MEANDRYIAGLIDKYFKGLTTLQEEETLRDYFQEKHIPEEWKMYQPMFQYFSDERKTTESVHKKPNRVRLWMSIAAAACVILFFGLKFTFHTPTNLSASSQMYIDGKKYTDIERIQLEAIKALDNFSEDNDDVYSSQVEALDLFFNNN